MRISNNNVNEEEKDYWDKYGEKIFEYSLNLSKFQKAQTDIPEDILRDYLDTRDRNFEINKYYLELAKSGIFENLIFSKDDCAEFGLNVEEAKALSNIIQKENLPALVKTGADEIPLSLFSRAVTDLSEKKPRISVEYTEPACVDLISNYEDVSIKKCVEGQ